MGSGGLQDRKAVVGCPLEQVAQIVTVGVEGSAAVAGQERHRGQLSLVDRERVEGRGDRPLGCIDTGHGFLLVPGETSQHPAWQRIFGGEACLRT